MAQEVTLDSIIRRNLAMRKLPLHYYFPALVFAKRGLEEMHFHSLQKIKVATIAIDPTLRSGTLPLDFMEEIAVGIEIGDKIRPIGLNSAINRRSDGGVAFPEQTNQDSVFNFSVDYMEHAYTPYGDYVGRNFGRSTTFTDSYKIVPELNIIRVDNTSDIASVQLTYLSMPEKVTGRSVVHPMAQATLHSWINWQWSVYNKEKDQEQRRRDYYNDLRIFRASKNKITTTEIKRIVRKSVKLSIK